MRWQTRETIEDKTRNGRPRIYGEADRLAAIGFYCQTKPFEKNGRWTFRFAAQYLKKYPKTIGFSISKSELHRILSENELKPHRSKYFLHISDPDFFPKMRHIIDLYETPPKNLYSFDECPGIQVLQRLCPDLQTEETKIRLEEFEYIRNGTMDVFGFYNVNNGKIHVDCRADHTKETLCFVFEKHLKIVTKNNDDEQNYIMDNLNTHCCYKLCQLVAQYSQIECPDEEELNSMEKRREWLGKKDKRIIFHYTPFHGSWLNKIEIWFGILNSKCLNETYTSADEMLKSIYKLAELWNEFENTPIKWKYDGKGLQQKAIKRFTKILNQVEMMDGRILVKMIKLMKNLITDEWDTATSKVWEELCNKLNEKSEQIISKIETRPPTKINSELAILKNLKKILNLKIKGIIKKVA